jgi:hypothetical protein
MAKTDTPPVGHELERQGQGLHLRLVPDGSKQNQPPELLDNDLVGNY